MEERKINYKQRAERIEQLCKMFYEIYKSKCKQVRTIKDKILLREAIIFGDMASIAERWNIDPKTILMVLNYDFKTVDDYDKAYQRRTEQNELQRKAERRAERRNQGEA